MPLQQLQFRPGINREGTTLANEGGWFECDKVRFRSGYPEKIGGWAAISYNTFLGVCRSLWNWVTLKNFNLASLGTNLKFYIENGGSYYDVTPIRYTSTGAATFAATPGSSIVTVTDVGSNTNQNDFVRFSNAIALSTQTITITIASPAVITLAAALPDDTPVILSTTGALPTGLVAGTTYYVINAVSTTCNLSATVGGPAINTSGSQSGVHSLALTTGITAAVLNREFQVIQSLSSSSYRIDVGTNATVYDVGNGGSSTVAAYQLTTGLDIYSVGTGWGTGPWSRGGWGSSFTTGIGEQLRLWSQTTWGEYLVFCQRGGPICMWAPGAGATPALNQRGEILGPTKLPPYQTDSYIPAAANLVLTSNRTLLALGCTDIGSTEIDPMLIRWSEVGDYSTWDPITDGATAGDLRLSNGSTIIAAQQTRQEVLVWTDSAIIALQFGLPFIWTPTILAENISIISPNAAVTVNGVTYWMGTDKFYIYSGRVETLPCSLRQYIFSDINRDQGFQAFGGSNEGYSEVWWFYCSANSNQIDRYVIYNYLDKAWYYGTMGRTAWLDSPLRDFPMGVSYNNLLVYHEAANDDGTTNPPSPIDSYIQSSDFDIGDGHNYGFVWRMLPDITFDGSDNQTGEPSVTFTVRPRQNPGSPYGVSNTPAVTSRQNYSVVNNYNVQEFTEIVYTRIRGRQMAFKVSSNTLGTRWQLGVPRIDVRTDGRR